MAPEQQRTSRLDDPPTDSEEEDQEPSSQQRPSYEEEEDDDDDDDEEEEEEGEASSDEQEEDKDDEEEEHQASRAVQPVSKTPPPQPANSHPKPLSSSESESESESESDPPASKVKPLASTKPSKDQTKTTSSKLKPKRPAEDNDGHLNDPKRAKKAPEDAAPSDDEDTKKSSRDDSKKLFQRLFSEEDDIAILEGMVEFSSKTRGKDPFKCAEEFHDFMKRSKSLSFNASSNQLKQKIRRLKKKFENNAGKGKNGEGPSFSKPHEKEAFELSKKVWGGSGGEGNGAVEKAKPEKSTESAAKRKPEANSEVQLALADSKEAGKTDEKPGTSLTLTSMIMFDKVVGLCGMGEGFVRKRVESIEASKREELEGQWRKLQDAELELYVKRAELHAEQARLMLQANKSSKN